MSEYGESYFFGTSGEYSRYGPEYYLGNDCLTLAKKLYKVIKSEEQNVESKKKIANRAKLAPQGQRFRNTQVNQPYLPSKNQSSTNVLPSDDEIFQYYFQNNINKRSRSEPDFIKYLNKITNIITINEKIKEPLKDFLEIIEGNRSQYYKDYEKLFDNVLSKIGRNS